MVRVQNGQGPGWSGSRMVRVQDGQGPGWSGSRMVRVQDGQGQDGCFCVYSVP